METTRNAARKAAEARLADPAFAIKVLAGDRITTEICAYCHMIQNGDAGRCKYGVRVGGVKTHRFDEIEMDTRLAAMTRKLNGLEYAIRPNFWYGFDLLTEGIRFSTEYNTSDENIDMLVFDGNDPEHANLRYRVSFQAGTPSSVIFAAAAEAMSQGR